MSDYEDIEQLFKPQCEFKASDTLKQKVMEKARQEVKARRIVRMWLWLAAACVVGFMVMFLMPPKTTTEEIPLVAERVEMPKAAETSFESRLPEYYYKAPSHTDFSSYEDIVNEIERSGRQLEDAIAQL